MLKSFKLVKSSNLPNSFFETMSSYDALSSVIILFQISFSKIPIFFGLLKIAHFMLFYYRFAN